ncbi:MAG: hypothetical protein KAI70_08485, partial [Candidatus Omnitrophica bacterium]|nr:hypothetical protein [Candidatus Omnitrophota bacterium]
GLGKRASADLIKSFRLVPIGAKEAMPTVPMAETTEIAALEKEEMRTMPVKESPRVTRTITRQKITTGTTFENEVKIPLNNRAWKAQRWHDTQAVKKVYWDKDAKALVGEVILEEGHETNDRGELIVDVTHLRLNPFNFTNFRIEADVKVVVEEGHFGGTPKAPDGVGIFVKTGDRQGWTNMYDWENMPPEEVGVWKPIGLDLSEAVKRDLVYRDANFPSEKGEDPIIQMFGVKIGAGTGTGSKFKGKIYVRNLKIIPIDQVARIPAPVFWPEISLQTEGEGIINIPADAGWTFRDMKGNKAVQAVYVKGNIVAAYIKFKGGDPFGDFNKGSTYLTLYDNNGKLIADVPGLPKSGFFDMTGKVLKTKIWAPESFAQGKTIPSAIVPGGKDYRFKFQNGGWQAGLITRQRTGDWDDNITYYPSNPRENNPGWTDDDFEVTKGREILIKAGLPGATDPSYEWEGWVYFSDIRFEKDNRQFADPVPQLTWTEPFAKNAVDQLPCSPEVFKTWSGGSGYGLFDQDLTPGGLRELDRKLSLMGPEVKMWRHMAVFGSLAPGGAIAFDKNDMPLGFADPSTGRMGKNQFDKLPIVLKRIDQMLSLLKKHDKKMTFVFLAHDFADGMKKKENRLEGDRPS